MAKKCTKKSVAHAELLFCLFNHFAFLTFSLSASWLLKVPINGLCDTDESYKAKISDFETRIYFFING